jgi:hypothetical protein
MTDAELAERVWDCARRIADFGPAPSEDDEEFSAVRLRHQIEEARRELGSLIDDRYRAMARTAGLDAGEYGSIHKHYTRLAESDPQAHLFGSLRHLRAALDKREYWAFWVYDLTGKYDPIRGGESLRKVFDEVRDLAVQLSIERPVYPEDSPTYSIARNHWTRLREYIDRITPTAPASAWPLDPQRRAEIEEALRKVQARFAAFAQVVRESQPHIDAARDEAIREIGEQIQQLSVEASEEERQLFIAAGWENPPGLSEFERWVAICRQYGIDPAPLTLGDIKDMVLERLELVRVEEAIRSQVRETKAPKETLAAADPPAAVPARANGEEVKPKKSTQQGDARAKLIAALTAHHQYENGGCGNTEPVGVNVLARTAEVSGSTVSGFFETQFKGHAQYKAMCHNSPALLVTALKLLNGEVLPHVLIESFSQVSGEDRR